MEEFDHFSHMVLCGNNSQSTSLQVFLNIIESFAWKDMPKVGHQVVKPSG